MSIIKRKKLYLTGLESWEKIRAFLQTASYEECPVCQKNNCHQYNTKPSIQISPSSKAEDCPSKENPALCRQMRIAKENLLKLRKKVDNIIIEIKVLHVKEGILKIEV